MSFSNFFSYIARSIGLEGASNRNRLEHRNIYFSSFLSFLARHTPHDDVKEVAGSYRLEHRLEDGSLFLEYKLVLLPTCVLSGLLSSKENSIGFRIDPFSFKYMKVGDINKFLVDYKNLTASWNQSWNFSATLEENWQMGHYCFHWTCCADWKDSCINNDLTISRAGHAFKVKNEGLKSAALEYSLSKAGYPKLVSTVKWVEGAWQMGYSVRFSSDNYLLVH